MSRTPKPLPPDDRLTAAAAALKDAGIADGPSDELVRRTLQALLAEQDSSPHASRTLIFPRKRRQVMLTLLKLTAAAVLAAGTLFLANWSTPLAFAEVAETLRQAHSLSYRMTVEVPELPRPLQTRMLYQDPGRLRTESLKKDGPVSILDVQAGKAVVLDPTNHQAIRMEGSALKAEGPGGVNVALTAANYLRSLVGREAQPLGRQQVEGIEAEGFRVEDDETGPVVVWADPATRRPIRIEMELKVQGQTIRSTIDQILIDPELAPDLFELTIPEGYQVQKDQAITADPEEVLVWLLRSYAQASGGSFPKRLDDFQELSKIQGDRKVTSPTDPELQRTVQSMVRVFFFLKELDGKFTYSPEGVKLGDADKVVFRYRPEGSGRDRLVHGDLHISDAPADPPTR